MLKSSASFSLMRRSRIAALQILYQIEFYEYKKPIDSICQEIYNFYCDDFKPKPIDKILSEKFIEKITATAISKKSDILDTLSSFLTQKWKIEDLTLNLNLILRLATSEIISTDTDLAIIINEYIEITKLFESNKESKFVNSVLQQVGDTSRNHA